MDKRKKKGLYITLKLTLLKIEFQLEGALEQLKPIQK